MIKSIVLGLVALIACTDAAMAQNRQQGQRQQSINRNVNINVNRNVTYNTNMAYPYSNNGFRGGWYGGDPYNSGVAISAIQGGTAVILRLIDLAGQQQAQQQPRTVYVPCPYRSCQ